MTPQMNTDERQSGKAATKNLTAETLVVRKNRSARAAGHVSFDNSFCVNRTFAPPVRDATFFLTTEEYAHVVEFRLQPARAHRGLKAELHARTKDLVVFGWEFTLEPVLRPCRLKPELHT